MCKDVHFIILYTFYMLEIFGNKTTRAATSFFLKFLVNILVLLFLSHTAALDIKTPVTEQELL